MYKFKVFIVTTIIFGILMFLSYEADYLFLIIILLIAYLGLLSGFGIHPNWEQYYKHSYKVTEEECEAYSRMKKGERNERKEL